MNRNKKIDITFIIAIKEISKNLCDTINSICRVKTDILFEIIIMNKSAIGAIRKKKMLKLINYKDSGIYDAWNEAIKISKGNFISFIGDDDILLENYFATYSKYLEKNNVDLILTKSIGKNTRKIFGENWNWKKMKRYMNISHVGSLHSRNIFKKYGYFDIKYKICADYDFFLRTNNQLNIVYIDIPTVIIGENGVSRNLFVMAIYETFKIKKIHNTSYIFILIIDFLIAILKIYLRKIIKF